MPRPGTFDEFVGQQRAVDQLKLALESAVMRDDVVDHILLTGPAGTGKTTIANIIAAGLGTRCVETIANVMKQPADAITSLVNLRRGDVLFVDEVHALPVPVQEYLYTAMEDYKINTIAGRQRRAATIELHKFILIGATTNEGRLTGPMRSRFGIVCNLEPYNQCDLEEIVQRAATSMGMTIEEDARATIADRCRATPRIAGRQLRRVRDSATVLGHPTHIDLASCEHAYHVLGITKRGLTDPDRKVLQVLAGAEHATGLDALAGLVHLDRDVVEQTVEPHLMRLGLIARTPRGRKITAAGRTIVAELES